MATGAGGGGRVCAPGPVRDSRAIRREGDIVGTVRHETGLAAGRVGTVRLRFEIQAVCRGGGGEEASEWR